MSVRQIETNPKRTLRWPSLVLFRLIEKLELLSLFVSCASRNLNYIRKRYIARHFIVTMYIRQYVGSSTCR